jgi:hypothetical protein
MQPSVMLAGFRAINPLKGLRTCGGEYQLEPHDEVQTCGDRGLDKALCSAR